MPIRPFPMLLLRKGVERILIITDLHMGWEAALVKGGIHVPSQTPKILKKLVQFIKSNQPTRLICLGDVKHSIGKVEREEWRDIPHFFKTIGEMVQDIWVIPGNHDGNLAPLLPEDVKILPSYGVVLFGDIGLFHGHTWPSPELLGCHSLIIGHVHPMVAFRDPLGFRITRQVWVKARCDGVLLARSVFKHLNIKGDEDPSYLLENCFNVKLKVSQLFIVPSFNELIGGKPMNSRKNRGSRMLISPVLRSGCVDTNHAELYLLDGTLLGSIGQLRPLA